MTNENATYETTIAGFATKLSVYTNSDDCSLASLLSNDLAYIKQMIATIATIYNRPYQQVDNDIANYMDKLEETHV